ncbi:hypothetical protein [Cohnella lupini]|uniref:Uncharacterized protein n=1 Tax=Cohnella lupini TaxID=1294267 RepID=A0A3D9ITT3_9BACL|nr:hypothetical protein [Cohnella lupini]RED64929.1 hypothetical protein DFP95_102351 [Cohnella lupini]
MEMSRLRYPLVVALLLALIFLFFQFVKTIVEIYPVGGFTVTVHNESDKDIVIVKAGLVSTDSKQLLDKKIDSGDHGSIRPDLPLTGEGAVYLEYIDSKGDTRNVVVCGYTESLSGRSKLTIRNDRFEVEQKCM